MKAKDISDGGTGSMSIVREWLKDMPVHEQKRAIEKAFERLDDSIFDKEGVDVLTDKTTLSCHDGLFLVVKTNDDGVSKQTLIREDMEYGTLDLRVKFSDAFNERMAEYDRLEIFVGYLIARACASIALAANMGIPMSTLIMGVLSRLAREANIDIEKKDLPGMGEGYIPEWAQDEDRHKDEDGAALYY